MKKISNWKIDNKVKRIW